MLYVIEFDIAAAIIIVVLLVLTRLRHGYPTETHRLFVVFMAFALASSVTDCVSAYSISFSYQFPVWFNYSINVLYFLALNITGSLFFFYVLVMVREFIGEKYGRMLFLTAVLLLLLESAIILTTPITHAVFYFDSSLVYHHGILYNLFYTVIGLFSFMSIVLLVLSRKNINAIGAVAFLTFLLLEVFTVVFSILFPEVLLYCFAAAISLIVIYVLVENPLRHLHGNTTCYNRVAFIELIKGGSSSLPKYSIMAFRIENYSYFQTVMGEDTAEEYFAKILDFLHKRFKREQVFCLKPGVCAVVVPRESEEAVLSFLRGDGRKRFAFRGLSTDIAYAICVVRVPETMSSPEDVLHSIDAELEDAAAREIVYANCDTLRRIDRLEKISHIMQRVIEDLAIEVYYQPIWNCRTKSFDYAEALVRIKDAELGYISPDDAIPVVEQSGLIKELDYCILSTVCRDIVYANFKELGVSKIAINLSMVECAQPGIAESTMNTIESYGLRPDQLCFEITETAAIDEQDIVHRNIEKMIERGFAFALDDFGTGYSSMDYLLRIPVEVVKIDKSILWRSMNDENGMAVLTRLVEGMKGMGKKVVVEGVENAEMVEFLDTLQCDYHQGYYYSKPLSRRDYLAFLREKVGIEAPKYVLEGE